MKRRLPLLIAAASLLAACQYSPDETRAAASAQAGPQNALPELPAAPPPAAPAGEAVVKGEAAAETETATAETADQYETRYVVIADTSRQYRPLQRQMLRLQAATSQRIDTMGRFYDPEKNLIRLPDTAPADDKTFDDMYAGDYYPRRMSDSTLSVEYTVLYTPAHAKSMALVAGIFEQPRRADSLLAVVRHTVPTAFRVKTRMFMGCLH